MSRDLKYHGPALRPKPLGNLKGFDIEVMQPSHFVAGLMQLPMMLATKWNSEFVTYFKA